MDELDSVLLEILQAEGRCTNRELALRAGVAPSTALERVRALRERGVITGVHATVDPAAVGRPIEAMISVRLRPQTRAIMHGFRDFVAGLPETRDVYITAGTQDILVHVAVASTQALQDFVLDSLTRHREVADIRTAVVYEHLHLDVVPPA